MNNVIQFPKRHADSDVVQLLEHQLALAKEGKIKFIAIAAVRDDRVGYAAWCSELSSQQMLTSAIGAVAFCAARFNDAVVRGQVDVEDPDAA